MFRKELTSLMKKQYFPVNKTAGRVVIKGNWSLDEDQLLVRLVQEYGVKKWAFIASLIGRRIGKQCRERWFNHLRPDIKRDAWTLDEEIALVEAHSAMGNRWAEIAKRIPGRTENSIKNHWNTTWRRQMNKRKSRRSTGNGRTTTVLQEYIRTIALAGQKGLEKPKRKVNPKLLLLKDKEDQGKECSKNGIPDMPVSSSALNGDMINVRMENNIADDPNDGVFDDMDLTSLLQWPSASSSSYDFLPSFYDNSFSNELGNLKNELDLVEMLATSMNIDNQR
ncbi:hypothetical protein C5167_010682 [Papaver somniferum]|uniref:Uncharacterized protein n=2 Tax=Papaver somniferum TaxID=3469 RepID=A0A4Y7K3R9_PAPSO|nr:hypothetical protein C5167_010682 [Papaver somniferum]